MARQRLDHENFPYVLILLLIVTSLGTVRFIFSSNRTTTLDTNTTERQKSNNNGINNGNTFNTLKNLRDNVEEISEVWCCSLWVEIFIIDMYLHMHISVYVY